MLEKVCPRSSARLGVDQRASWRSVPPQRGHGTCSPRKASISSSVALTTQSRPGVARDRVVTVSNVLHLRGGLDGATVRPGPDKYLTGADTICSVRPDAMYLLSLRRAGGGGSSPVAGISNRSVTIW